jgi:membrane protein
VARLLSLGSILKLLKDTFNGWNSHNAPRLGAALAYYTLLSIAPLLILIVAIFGLAFDQSTAEHNLISQVQSMVGASAARSLQAVLENAHEKSSGIVASLIAILTLLFGASGVFVELRDSLNTIWDAPPPASSNWKSLIWQRIVSFGMVLALGFLLLVSLVLSAAFAVVTKFFAGYLPMGAAVWGEVANLIVPLVGISVLFALIYKFVPDVRVDWRDVIIGAVATAILFQVGKALLALYLATAGVGSTYGAAGSLVAFVVWVYYSAQIFFFGAVFTHVYAECYGSHAENRAPTPATGPANVAPSARARSASI